MKHIITEFIEWPKGLEICYHDFVVRATKNEIEHKLGIKPKFNQDRYKSAYDWNLCLDGKYYFTIYDMERGEYFDDDELIEFHIGFDDDFDDIREGIPSKKETFEMFDALLERGLAVDHSEIWKRFHDEGVFKKIDDYVKNHPITI